MIYCSQDGLLKDLPWDATAPNFTAGTLAAQRIKVATDSKALNGLSWIIDENNQSSIYDGQEDNSIHEYMYDRAVEGWRNGTTFPDLKVFAAVAPGSFTNDNSPPAPVLEASVVGYDQNAHLQIWYNCSTDQTPGSWTKGPTATTQVYLNSSIARDALSDRQFYQDNDDRVISIQTYGYGAQLRWAKSYDTGITAVLGSSIAGV